MHKATDPSSRERSGYSFFQGNKSALTTQNCGWSDRSHYSSWLTRALGVPRAWVTISLRSEIYPVTETLGSRSALVTLESWVIKVLSSLRAWVAGTIRSPTILSSQNTLDTLKRWVAGALRLLGSVALCRVSSDCTLNCLFFIVLFRCGASGKVRFV